MNRDSAIKLAKRASTYTTLILFADSAALALDSLLLSKNMFRYLTLFMLGQAGLLFFVGGLMDIGGSLSFTRMIDRVTKSNHDWSAEHHKRTQMRAAPLIVTGALLAVLSFLLAYPLN